MAITTNGKLVIVRVIRVVAAPCGGRSRASHGTSIVTTNVVLNIITESLCTIDFTKSFRF